jgi:DNA polymerase-1
VNARAPVLLLDTYSLFFRSFYGLPPMTTAAGEPTGALYGFSVLLLKLLREYRPEGAAFAVDVATPSFRKQEYPEYKAGRPVTPGPLRAQLQVLPALLAAFGFPAHAVTGFEADDTLATLARELESGGHEVLIASGDRDLLQLVDARITVLFLGQRGKPPQRYDPNAVLQRFGVPARSLPSYVALVGDPSDNIPKLQGVDEVTAQRLIDTYGDIAGLLARTSEISDARLKARLAGHAEQLLQSERLARLRADVPLGDGPRFLALSPGAIERTRGLFEQLEFKSLLPRLEAVAIRAV